MVFYLSQQLLEWSAGTVWAERLSALRLFRYITVRSAGAALTALVLSLLLGPKVIAWLKQIKFGQEYADKAEAMRGIADGLNRLEMPVIFPVHPRTRARLEHYDITWGKHVHLMEPVGYLDMMALARTAYRILTDSGGLQKEAFLLGVPCVTLREETEWIETVEAGWNVLVGTRWEAMLAAVSLPQPEAPERNPFGEGDAAVRIAQALS